MLRRENRDLLNDVLGEIDNLYNAIILEDSNLSEMDYLRGTKSYNIDI